MPSPRCLCLTFVLAGCALVAQPVARAVGAEPAGRPVGIRVRWGGGTPQAWRGTIAVVPAGRSAGVLPGPLAWRTLCTEPDAAALARDAPGGIVVEEPRPIGSDGVEITVEDWLRSRLLVRLGPAAGGEAVTLDVPVAEILAGAVQRPLDDDGNRLTAEPAPGDDLRVTLADPAGGSGTAGSAVRRPGDVLRFHVDPLLPVKPGEGAFELRLRLTDAHRERMIDARVAPLQPRPAAAPAESDQSFAGRVPTAFARVAFELSLPAEEGVYEVSLEAVERGGLRWTRPLATRTLQVAALAGAAASPVSDDTAWQVIYELDPGSPKLHERLRRLPARGLAVVPVPPISLPPMPLPSLSRRLPLPRLPEVPGLPDVPRLPEVPMPNVSAMIPRWGGLLAAGHSVVVPHELGPLLRLPPTSRAGDPAWEGIVVAGAQPGLPHVVEIEHPASEQAAVAVCVLEPDATGSTVEVRHAGGYETAPPLADAGGPAPALARHRFVFWPTTRHPLVVLANAGGKPAHVGRVRVTAGPRRLPPAPRPRAPTVAGTAGRATLALIEAPDFHRRYGGLARPATAGGRPLPDWVAHLDGIRNCSDALAAAGLAGGVVVAYGGGAAAWPSSCTRHAPRWDPAAAGDAGLDPVPKDLLGAVADVYGQAGLRLVPAFCFDAAVPALEDALAGDEAAGIACVGADGRPRRLPGGVHYNILDPRVQRAVEEIVVEAARRVAGSPAAAGIALLLPHDGWLHLPGVAWGLDDATFGRFLAAVGETETVAGPERFAGRARLVSGPLRERWLTWRSGELAAFHARLARAVAEIDEHWPLYVAPTTLFTAGPLAQRFRPSLADRADDDLLREAGLVAALPPGAPSAGRLIFMSPRVHAAAAPLEERSTVAAANASPALARAAAEAPDRGVVLVSRPLAIDLAAVVPHGPFGTATPPPPVAVSLAAATAGGDRELAEALVAADAETVFDMRAGLTLPEGPPPARRAFEALPAAVMRPARNLPAPLVVRTVATGVTTRLAVVNAGPAAASAVLTFTGRPSAAVDAADGSLVSLEEGGRITVPLPAWGVRSLVIDGGVGLASATVAYDEQARAEIARRIERLRLRLGVIERPAPLDVLDNPRFELGLDGPAAAPAVTGWELVEPRRGSLRLVAGRARAGEAAGRGLEFSSRNGLSTLRSNPFPPPVTGRISVATWLRVKPGDPQPPLRIAIEGVEEEREYYRFAAIGGLAGGRPLAPEWSLFVLQVDDLPTSGVESLRVRFDLLGPGGVEIDDVLVCDLAFDADQRGRLAHQVARIDHRFRQGDVGGALVSLEDHWPAFLETFVNDTAVAALDRPPAPGPDPADPGAPPAAEPRQGMVDRFRGWWR